METIAELLPNETAYTVPWSLWTDHLGDLYINGECPILVEPVGTCQTKIRMNADRTVSVFRNTLDRSWSTSNIPDWKPISLLVTVEG